MLPFLDLLTYIQLYGDILLANLLLTWGLPKKRTNRRVKIKFSSKILCSDGHFNFLGSLF